MYADQYKSQLNDAFFMAKNSKTNCLSSANILGNVNSVMMKFNGISVGFMVTLCNIASP